MCRACLLATFVMTCVFGRTADVSAVNYRVIFEATWSAENHPDAYPGRSAHFSTPIGTTHSSAISLWNPGDIASQGIENVAETGSVGALRSQISTAITAGDALGIISGSTFNSPGSNSARFEAHEAFPLVSYVSMIAPSPDWFVGVHDLSLRDDNGWIPTISVPLAAYDAGTEDGNRFSTANSATVPRGTIQRLDTDPDSVLFDSNPLGTLIFELLPLCDINGDGRCDVEDLNSRNGLYSAGDLTQGIAVELGVNSRFDLNEDEIVDLEDLNVFLADAARENGFAEPYLLGDTNLNDHVGFGDFTALSSGFGAGREWTDGNYDGSIDPTGFSDFLALSNNFGESISRASNLAAVPEPSGTWLLLTGILLPVWLRPRRR